MFLAVQVFGDDQAHTESPRHSDDISADFKRMLVDTSCVCVPVFQSALDQS